MSDSNKKLADALELLNEAAKDKKNEIQNLLNGKYEHVKDAFQEATEKSQKQFDQAKRMTEEFIEEGSQKAKETVSEVEKNIRKNPWPYIGGIAVVTLLVGYILGSSKKE